MKKDITYREVWAEIEGLALALVFGLGGFGTTTLHSWSCDAADSYGA